MAELASLPWAMSTVLLPLLAAIVTVLPGRGLLKVTGAAALVLTLAASLALALQVAGGGPVRYELGGWGAPLGIDLVADGLAAVLVLLTALVQGIVSLYALATPGAFYGSEGNRSFFWPVWFFLWAALNALFLSGDVFNLYVTLELSTLAAVVLASLTQRPEALFAAMRYLLAALVGSLAYLLGVGLLYGDVGVLDLEMLGERVAPGPAVWVAAALMTGGLLLKTALFPLHFWLPPAHANAASPVSAVLSALVVKASFYLLLRLWLGPFSELFGAPAWHLLGAFGAAAVLWGGVQALRQERLKLIVAYSTVGQLGYLFLFFPLALSDARALAYQGVICQLLAHATAKSAAFLAAGNLMHALGHDRLSDIVGLRRHVRVSLLAFALAGTSLMGLPPSGGFLAKWLLLVASLQSGQWWWAVVVVVGGILAAGYIFRVLRAAMAMEVEQEPALEPVPRAMELCALALALLALVLGLAAAAPLALVEIGEPGRVLLRAAGPP